VYSAESNLDIGGATNSTSEKLRLSRFGATHAVRGMMFDVTAIAPHAITLDRLDLNLLHGGDAMNCTLYVKKQPEPWMGSALIPGRWEPVARREVVSTEQDPLRSRSSCLFVMYCRKILLVVAGSANSDTSTFNVELLVDPVLYSAARFGNFYQHWIFNRQLDYTAPATIRCESDQLTPHIAIIGTNHTYPTHFETSVVFSVRAHVGIMMTNLCLLFYYAATKKFSVWTKASTHVIPADNET